MKRGCARHSGVDQWVGPVGHSIAACLLQEHRLPCANLLTEFLQITELSSLILTRLGTGGGKREEFTTTGKIARVHVRVCTGCHDLHTSVRVESTD